MAKLPVFDITVLEKLCQALAEGMTGSQMTPLLARLNAPDPGEGMTKWRRMAHALAECQRQYSVGNHVVQFVNAAMEPVRFVGDVHRFEDVRAEVNKVLAFAGYRLGQDGKVRLAEVVTNLADAEERAGRLRAELSRRRVHPDVLKACRAELLQDNYFHAVLEATKSIAEKIRQRTGLTTDGYRLVDDALGLSSEFPRLAFNSLRTDSERNEHLGLMNLMKGAFSAFRNPTAHEPKGRWPIGEEDALDLLSVVSLLQRRLDGAVVVRTQ
jgi:uncharacterized protein (TIGR02391 family)